MGEGGTSSFEKRLGREIVEREKVRMREGEGKGKESFRGASLGGTVCDWEVMLWLESWRGVETDKSVSGGLEVDGMAPLTICGRMVEAGD